MNEAILLALRLWLDKNGIESREERGSVNGEIRLRIVFPDGYYIRVSDCCDDRCYVRDNGVTSWMSLFDLGDLIREVNSKYKKEN